MRKNQRRWTVSSGAGVYRRLDAGGPRPAERSGGKRRGDHAIISAKYAARAESTAGGQDLIVNGKVAVPEGSHAQLSVAAVQGPAA